eukprot:43354-Eustigmatos_ZCMA.PRE.1
MAGIELEESRAVETLYRSNAASWHLALYSVQLVVNEAEIACYRAPLAPRTSCLLQILDRGSAPNSSLAGLYWTRI